LHFIPDRDDPVGVVNRLRAALAPGSYLAISHGTVDNIPREVAEPSIELMGRTPTPPTARSRAEVSLFFAGLDLVPPGLVWVPQGRPEHPDDVGDHPERSANYVAVGRKGCPRVRAARLGTGGDWRSSPAPGRRRWPARATYR